MQQNNDNSCLSYKLQLQLQKITDPITAKKWIKKTSDGIYTPRTCVNWYQMEVTTGDVH